ncbi:MAG: hypothetical protein ACLR8P_09920 [Clostridium fessum]
MDVWIENDHFHVKTRYGILGIGNDAVIGDCGHTDAEDSSILMGGMMISAT